MGKGHPGVPGNKRADQLAGKAAESRGTSTLASPAYLKSRISERLNTSKEAWNRDPKNHGGQRDTVSSPQEIVHGQGTQYRRPRRRSDPDGPLALSSLPQEDQET